MVGVFISSFLAGLATSNTDVADVGGDDVDHRFVAQIAQDVRGRRRLCRDVKPPEEKIAILVRVLLQNTSMTQDGSEELRFVETLLDHVTDGVDSDAIPLGPYEIPDAVQRTRLDRAFHHAGWGAAGRLRAPLGRCKVRSRWWALPRDKRAFAVRKAVDPPGSPEIPPQI